MLIVSVVGLGSCQSGGITPPASLAAAPAVRTRGLPRDIDPAVKHAVSVVGYAIVRQSDASDGSFRTYELVNTKGEPGWLQVAIPAVDSDVPTDLTVRASLGRFGDVPREQQLIRAVRDRLEVLRKRGY